MDEQVKNNIFLLGVITLIFVNIPNWMQLNFLMASMSGKISVYIFFVGVAYWIFNNRKRLLKINLARSPFLKYISIYFIFVILSMIHGLYIYPYFSDIINGPAGQIDKLDYIYDSIYNHGISITKTTLLSLWVMIRPIKGLIFTTIYTFIFSYIIYLWYKNNWQKGIHILNKGICISIIIILCYCVLECLFLLGNEIAANILANINPLIHQVKNGGDWWPPLLWYGQLRSLFPEPSYYGIYAAFALPWLWYSFNIETNKRRIYLFLITLFTFCLFLTKARTAVMLLNGEMLIYLIYSWVYRRFMMKNCLIVLLSTLIVFFVATIFINHERQANMSSANVTTATSYLEDNMASLASADKRSNRARYSIMEANFNIGKAHPVLGVGYSLRQAYTVDYLPQEAFNNHEIQGWIKIQQERGIMKSEFPPLGDFLVRFAETGILGLMIFLLPAMYLLYSVMRIIIYATLPQKERMAYIFFSISFLGILASGIGDTLNITYCYWVLLGIGYAMIAKKDEILSIHREGRF